MAKKMGPKYKTLAELKVAYDSGELNQESVLTIDNDNCFVFLVKDGVFESADPVFMGGGPNELIWVALALLGIPAEPC